MCKCFASQFFLLSSGCSKFFSKFQVYIVLDLCFGRDMHVTIVGMYCPLPAHFEALEDIAKLWSLYVSSELIIMGELNPD